MLDKLFLTSVKIVDKKKCYQEKIKREIYNENELEELIKKYGDENLEDSISSRVYHEFENSPKFLGYVNCKAEKEYLKELRRLNVSENRIMQEWFKKVQVYKTRIRF